MSRSNVLAAAAVGALLMLLGDGSAASVPHPAAGAAPVAAAAPAAGPAPSTSRLPARFLRSAPFVLPVPPPGTVLTPFRAPASSYGPGHRGVDLALAVGGQVRAAGAGVVTHAGPVAGRGTVTVAHPDGLRTTYEPVTATVRTGQAVEAGQPIGVLQAGHPSCAPVTCLHWGARLPDGAYLDPMGLVDGLRVRLLPWDQARG